MDKLVKKKLYTLLIILTLVFSVFYIYESYKLKKTLLNEKFEQLVVALDERDEKTADRIYKELEHGTSMYAHMVQLTQASELANKGELQQAKVIVNRVIAKSNVDLVKDPAYLRLVQIKGELKEFDDLEQYHNKCQSKIYNEYIKYEIAKIYDRNSEFKRAIKFYNMVELSYLANNIQEEVSGRIKALND